MSDEHPPYGIPPEQDRAWREMVALGQELQGEPTGVMILPCPCCPVAIEVSEEDPDAALSEMYDHLYRHTRDRDEHYRLFLRAQENARVR